MTSFIQAHLQSILAPFADHVDELHRTLDELRAQLQQTASTAEGNSGRLDELTGLVGGLRADQGRTAELASSTQQGLERLSSETADLSSSHRQAQAGLAVAEERLQGLEAALSELQGGLKGTRGSVGKMREGLSKLERDMAVRVGPTVDKLVVDVKNLDTMHQGTVQSLGETRSFAECFHKAFQVFEKEDRRRQARAEERFEQGEAEVRRLQQALKDQRDRDQLQKDHLNRADTAIASAKRRLDQLEASKDEGGRRHHEIEKAFTDMQVRCNSMNADLDKLTDFRVHMQENAGMYEAVTVLKREMEEHAQSIHDLVETTGSHDAALREGGERAAALERSQAALQAQASKLSERIGSVTPAHSRSPSRERHGEVRELSECRPRSTAGHYSYKDGVHVKEPMPVAVLRALDKMSIAARQQKAIAQINENSRELANTTNSLSKTACHLDNTETRVSDMESQLVSMKDEMRRMSMAMELNQEYWKGLSKGLKETNRSVAEGEVLPPRGGNGMKLPSLGRPPSCQHHAPCVMSAR